MKALKLSSKAWGPAAVWLALAICGHEAKAAESVDFGRDILPILENRCFGCHGPEKQKSHLRFDKLEVALELPGVIVPGKAEESEMWLRISLPADDIDIMPPKGDPLTAEQIELIKAWIDGGAEWSPPAEEEATKVTENSPSKPRGNQFAAKIQPILASLKAEQRQTLMQWIRDGAPGLPPVAADGRSVALEAAPTPPPLEDFPISDEENEARKNLLESGVLVLPRAQGENWVEVNFRLAGGEIDDRSLAPLWDIKHATAVDLSRTGITDEGLAGFEGLTNLQRLNLNHTAISDAGLSHLANLPHLTYLNLYATKVTDAGLRHLHGLQSLRKLFLWQTAVSDNGVEELQAHLPHVEVVRGVTLADSESATPKASE